MKSARRWSHASPIPRSLLLHLQYKLVYYFCIACAPVLSRVRLDINLTSPKGYGVLRPPPAVDPRRNNVWHEYNSAYKKKSREHFEIKIFTISATNSVFASLFTTHITEYNQCNTVWSIIMMFYIPPNTKANSSKMQHLLSPTQTMAQGGTTGLLGRQLMELFHEISELDKSKLTSGISINFC